MKVAVTYACLCLALLSSNAAHADGEPLPGAEQRSPLENAKPLLMNGTASPGETGRELPTRRPLSTEGTAPSSWALFHDVPSISGQYSVGGTTVRPYIGAGFGGGYSTERERALNSNASGWQDPGIRSQWNQLGQGFAPNEFQMGVRIPF